MGRKAERKDSSSSSSDEGDQEKESKEESTKVELEPITEIEFKFLLQDIETTTEGLSKFISCAEAYSDGVPCPDIVAKYLKSSPNCVEVLNLLEPSETSLKSAGIALVFKCLEQILTRIRTDLTKNLAAGETIVQKILAGYMRPVYASLQAQSKSNVIKSAVQLLIAMALLSEKTKKALQARLNFNHVHFSALFRRRNRKDPQDVRSCMILLTLAFIVNSDSNTVRFMVQQRTFLQMTIAGLKFDSRDVVVDVLLTFLDKIVKNSSVSKTDKTKLFSEVVLRQIAELHQWQGPLGWSPSGKTKLKQAPSSSSETSEDLSQVADIADSFLQELCCSPKHGIGFYDRSVGTAGRCQNMLLSHFASWLGKHLEEPRKAGLTVNILASSPDLVSGAVTELQTSLEPRWSDSWAHRLDWLVSLYNALPSIPPFLEDKERKISREHNIVTMATVFCLPPTKVSAVLNQSLRHEDIRVRHSYLELAEVLVHKSCRIRKALAAWSVRMGHVTADTEQLTENFTATVLKGLPPVSQLFACVDKIMALTAVASAAGEDGVAVVETKLGVGLGEHTSLLLQVLGLYQTLMPSLLAQRPKDISKLIQVVSGQLEMDRAGHISNSSESQVVEDDSGEGLGDSNQEKRIESEEKKLLPQLYLLKLLSETDARTLSLTKEGMLEKLLLLAEHNRYMDLTVRLICKMLESVEIFSNHGQELTIWLRKALEATKTLSTPSPPQPAKKKPPKKHKQTGQAPPEKSSNLTRDSHKSILPFLARCISSLVNNPSPYTDRVMEALSDRPETKVDTDEESEELMETSSLGANEAVKQAILLMDDEELDQLVALSATEPCALAAPDGETSPRATGSSKANFELPVSPLILAALDQLSFNKEAGTDVRDYVGRVVIDLVHSLPDPGPLTQIVVKSDIGHHLPGNTSLYLKSLMPSLKQEFQGKQWDVSSAQRFTSMLVNLRNWNWDGSDPSPAKQLEKAEKQLCDELVAMTKSQRLAGLGQAMLYMGEILAAPLMVPRTAMFVHAYRVVAERCLDLLVGEDTTNVLTAGDGKVSDKVLDIISALDLREPEICSVVKRMLLSPALLNALNTSKFYEAVEAGLTSKKSSLLSQESTVIVEILSLYKTIFEKTIHFQWFQTEADLIEKHLAVTTDLLTLVFKEEEKSTPRKTVKKEDKDEKKQIALCCYEILDLLFKTLDVKSLSGSLSKLFKLLPVVPSGSHKDKSVPRISSTANQLTFSKLESLVVKMLNHWTDQVTDKLMPDGIEVLLDKSYSNSKRPLQSKLNSRLRDFSHLKKQPQESNTEMKEPARQNSPHQRGSELLKPSSKALDLKIVLPFEEVSGMTTEHFKPLFDTVFCEFSSKPLASCITHLLTKLPQQLVPVCARSIPDTALSSASNLLACVGPEVAKLLIQSQTNIFHGVNSWLLRWKSKPPKHIPWWLVRAFLEAKDSFPAIDCHASIEVLKNCTQPCIKEAFVSATMDELVALKLICSCLEDQTDLSYVETLFTGVAAAVSDKLGQVSTELYEILLTCAETCPFTTLSHTEHVQLKLEGRILQMALTHLDRLASERGLDTAWEDYLLALALQMVQTLKEEDLNFLPSLWSSFVRNTLKHLYKNSKLLELLAVLAPRVYSPTLTDGQDSSRPVKTPGKTVAVSPCPRTLFNMCCSHTGFLAVLMSGELQHAKAGLVKLLFTLAEIEPACLDKQLRKVLVGAYSATMSFTDRYLLHMIEKISLGSQGQFECPLLWGKSVVEEQSKADALGSTLHRETPVSDVLSQLDVRLLHRSMLNFPLRQTMKGTNMVAAEELKSRPECYDPRFLLRVFAAILTPDKRVPLHQFVEKGCLGYLLTALSSHDLTCRLLAYQALNDLHLHAQGSRWSERVEVSFLLDLLNASRTQDGQKLSSVVALFFARVSRLLLYPADGLYMPIFRFLVARPEMDIRNVPEFYKLFFSPGSNYKQERNWCLSLLAEGLRETSDYWLYQKKSVFKIILSFYGSAISDKTSQALVLSVVKAACAEKSVAVHLVKEHGLLTWLSSAVDRLSTQGEHCDALCDIVHSLWLSLSANTQQSSKTLKPYDGEKDDGANSKLTEAQIDDSSDSEDDDDDDNKMDEDVESDDSTDEEETLTNQAEISKKRKKSTEDCGNKRQKLEPSRSPPRDGRCNSTGVDTEKIADAVSSDEDSANTTHAGSQISQDASTTRTTPKRSDKRQQVKARSQARMPKATVAELGLLVKSLIWQFSKSSIRSIGKVLEVYHGLIELQLRSTNTPVESPTNRTSMEQAERDTNRLTTLSAAEACVVLHRLGSAARIPVLASAAEVELRKLGVNVWNVLYQGAHSATSARGGPVTARQNAEEDLGLEEDRDAGEHVPPPSDATEEKEKTAGSQRAGEDLESGDCGSDTVLEERELARSLLMSTKEILVRTRSIKFV